MKNPWHSIKPKNNDGTFNVVIEISKGSQNKYELNLNTGVIEFEKRLKPKQKFIFNYGFIPQTIGGDNDPLDVVVLNEKKLLRETVTSVKLIGVMRMIDADEIDDKLIGILNKDEYWDKNFNKTDIVEKKFEKIANWFRTYKKAEETRLSITGFDSADLAKKEAKQAMKKYNKKFKTTLQ